MGEQKLEGFTFTLGYSRRIAAEVVLDWKLGTRMRLHEAGQEQRSAARSSCTRCFWTSNATGTSRPPAAPALSHPDARESGIEFSLFQARVLQRGDGGIAAMTPAIGTDTRDQKANE
jgi:hypothetical protein